MDQRTRPAPRLAPLPPEHSPDLKEEFEISRKRMGFVPNSVLIMQRSPKMVKGFTQLSAAIWDPNGKVDLKQLPPSLLQELELLGRLGLKADLTSLQHLEAASGSLALALKGAGVIKGTLKLGEGMSFPLPKTMLGDVTGSVTIDKGIAKIDKCTVRGGDVEADVDGTIRLTPLLSLSQAELHLRLKPSDKWLDATPLIKSSMGFLGPKGPDGYVFTLSGPLSRLQPRPGR